MGGRLVRMPEPVSLDYQRAGMPGQPKKTSLVAVVLAALVLLLLISILLPEDHGHEAANMAKCGNNLRQIGLACMMYCSDNKRYPDEAGTLMSTQELSVEVFVCPSSTDTPLKGAVTQPASAILSGGHCSYVYVG